MAKQAKMKIAVRFNNENIVKFKIKIKNETLKTQSAAAMGNQSRNPR